MATKIINLETLELDALGRVVLGDADLHDLSRLPEMVTAGGNISCTNPVSCGGSSNGSCTNRIDCQYTTNGKCV